MANLKNKRILLGVTGGIAAYKSAELVRLLKTLGAKVRVVMTEGAQNFITPLTLQTLSGQRVYETQWDVETENAMSHIDLARWAELILVAPATAHFIAKLAAGLADDLLTTLCLATSAPVAVAPAMNQQMWQNPATQANIKLLQARNIKIFGPGCGDQACGEIGPGRLLEPQQLVDEVAHLYSPPLLVGKRVVITAGPTQEAIDPVRYLSNHSSGKMGYAIAKAVADAGAEVILISGPTALTCSARIHRINVVSTEQMLTTVLSEVKACDIFISTAAVCDYRVNQPSRQKIKKQTDSIQLELIRNPDIVAAVSQLNPRPFIVGFAAETENLIEHAKQKLVSKKLDMIVANLVGPNQGFQVDDNELTVITSQQMHKFEYAPKQQLARRLVQLITEIVRS